MAALHNTLLTGPHVNKLAGCRLRLAGHAAFVASVAPPLAVHTKAGVRELG